MLGQVLGARERHQVLKPIVQLVPVDVVDNVATPERPVGLLPHMHRTHGPLVGLRNLDPSTLTITAMRADTNRPDREVVAGCLALLELRSDGSPCSFGRRGQRPSQDGRLPAANVGAVVNGPQFGPLLVEGHPADRTIQVLTASAIGAFHNMHFTGSGTTFTVEEVA